ncbi:hypothetical protein MF271_12115 [Deinococcus sp. KNUC1210]|uniref:hypothetical protein n=1 Tax=Deinococcus sp. KNUC1210 TaxID=2917691 RepID=UPI001EF08C40|nr:hypothetical protein [Deinococcus sp. KNUC1210]ULH14740.1 hypothetical protein MF271_12115 [Deinococcus sp. KNUC1210]
MRLEAIWNDVYGSTLALYVGRAGGHRWLLTCTPGTAAQALEGMARLHGKGSVLLVVQHGSTPLRTVLEEQQRPWLGRGLAGVLVLDRDLSGGPALSLPISTVQVESSGLSYQEGGDFPAWHDALSGQPPAGKPGTFGESVAASVCASLNLPVRVCAAERLEAAFQEWWAAGTPGGRSEAASAASQPPAV